MTVQRPEPFLYIVLFLLFCSLSACTFPQLGKKRPQKVESGVALLLPGSGPYTDVSSGIMDGARAARAELESQGTRVTVALIDTSKPNWLAKLREMPDRFTVIG